MRLSTLLILIALLTMNYRKLNNGIAEVLSPAECYTYFCLTLKSDFKTLESNVKQETLAEYVGISTSTIQRHLAKMCDELEESSADNTGGTVVFALNYGGMDEIVDAANAAIAAGEPVTRETFETFMDTGDLLPVDLMVRTSNEIRISNFLLWKLAYAELMFIPEHWPDLVKSEKIWQRTLDEFARRNRRFGGGKKANYAGKDKK